MGNLQKSFIVYDLKDGTDVEKGKETKNKTSTNPAVNIYKADDSVLGTCRVRHVDAPAAFGSNFRVFIFDVVMTGTNSFRDAVKIGPSTSARSTLVLEGSPAGAVG